MRSDRFHARCNFIIWFLLPQHKLIDRFFGQCFKNIKNKTFKLSFVTNQLKKTSLKLNDIKCINNQFSSKKREITIFLSNE